MASEIQIVKMHGAGNDFVVLDNSDGIIDNADISSLAIRLCDRHFGIGADGLLIVGKATDADASMRIINSDGSEAQMCGNGIRCIGKYLHDFAHVGKSTLTIDTPSGTKSLSLHLGPDGTADSITVDMGQATIVNLHLSLDTVCGHFDACQVSTGNPHAVIFVDELEDIDIRKIGPTLENHSLWPEKSNIEFAKVTSPHTISQRTWERGAGETLACGTGAIATATAAIALGLCSWPVEIALPGGNLIIDKNHMADNILMTGPSAMVFTTCIPNAML